MTECEDIIGTFCEFYSKLFSLVAINSTSQFSSFFSKRKIPKEWGRSSPIWLLYISSTPLNWENCPSYTLLEIKECFAPTGLFKSDILKSFKDYHLWTLKWKDKPLSPRTFKTSDNGINKMALSSATTNFYRRKYYLSKD